MSWLAKILPIVAVLLWSCFAANSGWADNATPTATPKSSSKGDKKDKGAKTDKPAKAGKNGKGDGKDSDFSVPIPVGHDATGIHLPSYDRSGQLQMTLSVEVARKVDDDHLEMNNVFLETYGDDGSPEMTVQSVASTLNLKTRVVTSMDSPTMVHRTDFEISGKNLVFDIRTRSGKFTGETRTVIYNLSQSAESEKKPAEPQEKK